MDGNNNNGKRVNITAVAQSVAAAIILAAILGWGVAVRELSVHQERITYQDRRIDDTVQRMERIENNIECIRASMQSLDRGQAVILEKLTGHDRSENPR